MLLITVLLALQCIADILYVEPDECFARIPGSIHIHVSEYYSSLLIPFLFADFYSSSTESFIESRVIHHKKAEV